MANAGTPHSNGSQFIVTLAPAAWMDRKYGMHVLLGTFSLLGSIVGFHSGIRPGYFRAKSTPSHSEVPHLE